MAIEKDINPTVLTEENQVPLGNEGMDVVLDAVADAYEADFVMQEDGSAILESSMQQPIQSGFAENLAELLDDAELMRISNQLVDGIEKDKSSSSSLIRFMPILSANGA